MTADKLNSDTPNNEVGLCLTKTRRIVIGQYFGELATVIKCTTAGTIVWYNRQLKEIGVWYLEAGECVVVACTEILVSGTVDGITETTTAGGLFWGTMASRIGTDGSSGR